jgi:DMSO/TMAO reductase YedYZ molybdopterin-dependent catalytic subunit
LQKGAGAPATAEDKLTMPIIVEGLVHHPGVVSDAWLEAHAVRTGTKDFHCLEGWTVPDVEWQGVAVSEIAAAVGALPTARFLAVAAGEFVAVVPAQQALDHGLVALWRDKERLSPGNGGPYRFVLFGGPCYTHVKHLERLRWQVDPEGETAQSIAIARIRPVRPQRRER